jgi:ppGpp synthetase/RelA/SpoT-type nucleotidyltranferase
MVNPNTQEAIDWYIKNRAIYQALTSRVESILQEILELFKINYHSISGRTKSIDSYTKKASSEKYREPRSEIKDMAGIRIITYTDSDAKNVTKIVEETFNIFPEHSSDKTKELGVDRMGYRSIHCVGTLDKDRLKLLENKIFTDMCFEIQVRTILQHAWAEFEHDRNYKFRGVLPQNIRRRLSTLAGTLEVVDREFDTLSTEIDTYALEISEKTESGDLFISINSTSLKEYMTKRFRPLIEKGVDPSLVFDEDIIQELSDMGINNIAELDNIIPKDYIEKKPKYFIPTWDHLGLIIRDILIIHDCNAYFNKAWKKKWFNIDKTDVDFYKSYGIDFDKYVKHYDLDVFTLPELDEFTLPELDEFT